MAFERKGSDTSGQYYLTPQDLFLYYSK